jgi:hypothetical protein
MARSGNPENINVGKVPWILGAAGGLRDWAGSELGAIRGMVGKIGLDRRLRDYDPKKDVERELKIFLPLIVLTGIANYQEAYNAGKPEEKHIHLLTPDQMDKAQTVSHKMALFEKSANQDSEEKTDGDTAVKMLEYILRNADVDSGHEISDNDDFLLDVDGTTNQSMKIIKDHNMAVTPDGSTWGDEVIGDGLFAWQAKVAAATALLEDMRKPQVDTFPNGPTKWDALIAEVSKHITNAEQPNDVRSALGEHMVAAGDDIVNMESVFHQMQGNASKFAGDKAKHRLLVYLTEIPLGLGALSLVAGLASLFGVSPVSVDVGPLAQALSGSPLPGELRQIINTVLDFTPAGAGAVAGVTNSVRAFFEKRNEDVTEQKSGKKALEYRAQYHEDTGDGLRRKLRQDDMRTFGTALTQADTLSTASGPAQN